MIVPSVKGMMLCNNLIVGYLNFYQTDQFCCLDCRSCHPDSRLRIPNQWIVVGSWNTEY